MKKVFKIASLIMFFIGNQWLMAQKIKITKADDLPRRSVTLKGKATEIVNDIAQLNTLNNAFIKNLEADLEKYEITDKATLKAYYQTIMMGYVFKKDYDKALSFIPKIQDLEDKKSEKLTTGLFLQAYAKTLKQNSDKKSEAFKQTFVKEYASLWKNLPYNEIKNELESARGSMSIFNPNLITSSLESQIQPFLDNNKNVVPEGVISNFTGIRFVLDERAALVPEMLKVLNEIYEKNKVNEVKKDIWAERDVALSASEKGTPVVVAVWDSGVDVNIFPKNIIHQDKKGKNGVGYSLVEHKNDGLLLDNPQGKIKTDIKRLQLLSKGFMDLQAGIESPEVAEVRKTIASLKPEQAKDFQEEMSFYGTYSHGTHVAGIAIKDNPFARLLTARMGWDYRTLPPAHTLEYAKFQANMYKEVVKYFKENNVKVVNMSWRYGVAAYEGILSLNGVGKNDEERKKMAREMFEIEKKALYEAFKSAPEILFICGSGNENNDAGFQEYIPASFQGLPNLITIGAVDNEGKKTSFTTEGKSVRFYANGFEVESFVPGGDKVKFSGTSMASPNVANLAAKILALKPTLNPKEVIDLIEKGSDNLPENPSLKLINPKKTIEILTGSPRATTNNNVTQLLLKKWKPDAQTASFMVEDYINEVRKQNAEQAKQVEAQKAMLVQIFSQVNLEYKADGSLVVTVPSSPAQTGSWKLSENNKKLTTNKAGQEDYEMIEEITNDKLVTTTSKGRKYVYLLAN
ncbi:MAG: S8 family serine peptidase [Raineya sp.]|jgi:subtilisin family serine protease|nr:S8 family serine peptidase [Raineya sp.]